jgi:hypothetical protein
MMKRKKQRANRRVQPPACNPFDDLFFWLHLASVNYDFGFPRNDAEQAGSHPVNTAAMPVIKSGKEPL